MKLLILENREKYRLSADGEDVFVACDTVARYKKRCFSVRYMLGETSTEAIDRVKNLIIKERQSPCFFYN